VAVHECGHVVQQDTSYPWLIMRSKLVPFTQVNSFLIQWVLFIGILTINRFPQLLLGGIILFIVSTLFTINTLLVEFEASRRALLG